MQRHGEFIREHATGPSNDTRLHRGYSFLRCAQFTGVCFGSPGFSLPNADELAGMAYPSVLLLLAGHWLQMAGQADYPLRNDGVGGSNPSCGTTLQKLMLRRKVVGRLLNLAFVSTW